MTPIRRMKRKTRTIKTVYVVPALTLLLTLISTSAKAEQPEVVIGPKDAALSDPQPGPLNIPFGIDFDKDDNMVIVEYVGARVFRLAQPLIGGKLTQIAGKQEGLKAYEGDGGPAKQAAFNKLHNVAITPDQKIYLSDTSNHTVRVIKTDGTIESFAGNGSKGFAGDGKQAQEALFNQAYCVSYFAPKNELIITDLGNRRIRTVNMATGIIQTVAGTKKKGIPKDGTPAIKAPLISPRAADYDKFGNLYIASRNGHALRVIKPDGKLYTVAGTGKPGKTDGPALKATLRGPKHLACDDEGNVYLADDQNHLVRKYDPKTKTISTVMGRGEFKLNRPHGVCVHKGYLYVVDSWNHRVVRIKLK